MTYQEAEAYINDTPRFTTKNTLENTKAVLEKMGHPERRMKLIHVAGSNGKGSVCAYLSSILTTSGKQTGLFTSPHLWISMSGSRLIRKMYPMNCSWKPLRQ